MNMGMDEMSKNMGEDMAVNKGMGVGEADMDAGKGMGEVGKGEEDMAVGKGMGGVDKEMGGVDKGMGGVDKEAVGLVGKEAGKSVGLADMVYKNIHSVYLHNIRYK
jgi:hypothetical protein